MGHSGDAFSGVTYEKGIKNGNAWLMNNRWYTYRNLWPMDEHQAHDERAGVSSSDSDAMKIAKRKRHNSKYKFAKIQERWLKRHPWLSTFKEGEDKSTGRGVFVLTKQER